MAKDEASDRVPIHRRRILLRPRTYQQLQSLAERDEVEIAELVNRAVRELLEKEGLWPPKGDSAGHTSPAG